MTRVDRAISSDTLGPVRDRGRRGRCRGRCRRPQSTCAASGSGEAAEMPSEWRTGQGRFLPSTARNTEAATGLRTVARALNTCGLLGD